MEHNNLQSVSIIIPCRNEKKFIGKCLDSILANNYPVEKMEIFVVDGMSTDGTRDIIIDYGKKYSFIRLLDNSKRTTPVALNIGIKNSKNNIIIRMDAHATYKSDYILKCATFLEKYDADNIGGVWIVKSRENTIIGRGISAAMSSFFGSGDAYYKIGLERLKIVDTVPFGCYKKEVFDKIGLFNENLERSQDLEFNLRLKKAGGRIYLFPEIVGYYYQRSKLKEFAKHNFKDGIWVTYPLRFVKTPFRPRHYVPLLFVLMLIFLIIAGFFMKPFFYLLLILLSFYLIFLLYFSFKIFLAKKDPTLLISLPVVFLVRHLSYGFGELWGAVLLLIRPKLK